MAWCTGGLGGIAGAVKLVLLARFADGSLAGAGSLALATCQARSANSSSNV